MNRMKKVKMNESDLVFGILAVFLLGFIIGSSLSTKTVEKETIRYTIPELPSIEGERVVSMLVPAIDSNGDGVAAKLITTVRPASGYGMILVSINDVLAQYDTQLSGRIAAKAAENYTKANLNNYDIIYSIRVNASVIEGPSAGSAMAVSIVAALENKTLHSDVMITGTIDENGSIGPAGAIEQKAKAAKENNITTFLVAPNLSYQYESGKSTDCRISDGIEYCEITYIGKKINIGEAFGLTVKEVANLEEALQYFISD